MQCNVMNLSPQEPFLSQQSKHMRTKRRMFSKTPPTWHNAKNNTLRHRRLFLCKNTNIFFVRLRHVSSLCSRFSVKQYLYVQIGCCSTTVIKLSSTSSSFGCWSWGWGVINSLTLSRLLSRSWWRRRIAVQMSQLLERCRVLPLETAIVMCIG